MDTAEPSIVPQVQEDSVAVKPEPHTLPLRENSPADASQPPVAPTNTVHNYSTRSKERHKEEELDKRSKLKQQQHNVVIHPRLKPVPFKRLDLAINNGEPQKNKALTLQGIDFYQSDDSPFNKRGFKYKPCRPNPIFTSNLYSTTDTKPYKVAASYFDRSSGVYLDDEMCLVTTTQGWRSIRSNIGVREGTYYFEFNIVCGNDDGSKAHVRIGLGRREASLEAPVGFDGYSYGFRDVNGEFMTLSRPKESYIEGGFHTGDVIGFLVELPSLEEHQRYITQNYTPMNDLGAFSGIKESESPRKKRKVKAKDVLPENSDFYKDGNILRDQIPIKYKNALFYEQYEYTNTKVMDHLLNPVTIFGEKAVLEDSDGKLLANIPKIPKSKITIFKNGVKQPKSIEEIYSFLPTDVENDSLHMSYNTKQQQNPNYRNTDDGSLGYYPMMSVFQGGIVGLNSGPDFKYPPSVPTKPLNDRYEEAVIDEWYWDLIDEVEARYMDSFEA
ncbi:uncharacterized protein CANTADRAFT_7087 [Suhomyces tanzawaensis NRRL Y-17324]|uniref:B30.2/SPRY domain-containing protein n=1 Tax=Suhomyces tanzawaensis NRRL Y-17324 TaxID=984487 RepID=A0A1E4SGW1_9ASCO|nr:uncharacterized protein CANTADRAFT_7087 [Suhomyces tanzawaensis NRRL Y-17324]ODV78744.1 hypothetical protein CANTADRAFT_7087 [Suhomyces tanzawaensis NRRL Y-17324]